ncbi:MAG: hypothetical protein JO265_10905, partial [Acidimicrobiia bacterium]|nr:hypothetical protein [Acidimicrobiia bacterium]
KASPGSIISSNTSRLTGMTIRRLRNLSRKNLNRSMVTDRRGSASSGWTFNEPKPNVVDKAEHYFYEKWQFWGTAKPGSRKSNQVAGRK